MKENKMNRCFYCCFLTFFLFGLPILFGDPSCVFGSEFSPKAVWSDAEVLPAPNGRFKLDHLIDGNLKTIAVLLDSSRTGNRSTTVPPKGDLPVTARLMFDLGSERETAGIRFITCGGWKTLGVKNVSVFTSSDLRGTQNVRWLQKNVDLLRMNYGCSVPVSWDKTVCRYLGVEINDSWQIRDQRQGLSEENAFDIRLAEIKILTEKPEDPVVPNDDQTAFPKARLVQDWIMQDAGSAAAPVFLNDKNADLEKKIISKVLSELKNCRDLLEETDKSDSAADSRSPKIQNNSPSNGSQTALAVLNREFSDLSESKAPGKDKRWKDLYLRACEKRRAARLAVVLDTTDRIIYAKHFVFGGTEGLSINADVTDRQYRGFTPEGQAGSQLCMITLREDGSCRHEVLLDRPNGLIRDPNISWDAETVYFSMLDVLEKDDYHLYKLDLTSRKLTQLTFTPEKNGRKYPCADIEPCVTPSGDLVFTSTRNSQINDCWPGQNTNLFICRSDGSEIRRLTYDELEVYNPQVLNDGRIVYTHWEYSDRNAYFLHPLYTMNPDGTMQTEYVGNNSMYPASYLQARPIPGSTRLMAIISGHHVPSKGKLALIDRTLGTQDGKCIEYVAGSAPDGTPGRKMNYIKPKGYNDPAIDHFGQKGPQFQNPFPLDEDHYLTAYSPEGWPEQSGPYYPPFGIYFMDAEGNRELLAFDWRISCTQPLAVAERDVPPVKPSQVKPEEKYGTFIVQDIYYGPGLKGIPRGTIEKLRVIALEYRAAWIGTGPNAGEADVGYVQTPISMNNGAWDVKHVLGEVDIEKDGSCAFKVPARTPVYFQLLDKNGYCVQTMRSWSTLQGGETFSCLGCHEDKLETGMMEQSRPAPLALKKAPQRLRPSFGIEHPLIARLEKEEALDSVQNYIGVNASHYSLDSKAPVQGFSFVQRIQPILDRHCIGCHTGDTKNPDKTKASALSLTGEIVEPDISDPRYLESWYFKRVEHENYNGIKTPLYIDWKRDFTQSYFALTNIGKLKGSKWVQWLEVRSRAEMLPPYHTGSAKSPLMKYLEPSHYNVRVSKNEKRTIACWIDLLIPFCGSYAEANRWDSKEKETWNYYFDKRIFFTEQEMNVLKNKKSE